MAQHETITQPAQPRRTAERSRSARRPGTPFLLALSRAAGGALFFALPLFMTMEMWWLGFYMDRLYLGILMLATIPILVALTRFFGFYPTYDLIGQLREAMIGYGVGLAVAAIILLLIGVLGEGLYLNEFIGKLGVQAVPASIGAVVAASQFAPSGPDAGEDVSRRMRASYGASVFFMFAGALYLAIAVAPTEEMIVVSFKMSNWHLVALALASIVISHALVYTVDFKSKHVIAVGTPWWSYFLRFTMVGYAIALLVSAYVLLTFGRYDTTALIHQISEAIVLGFPASLGASASRLIL